MLSSVYSKLVWWWYGPLGRAHEASLQIDSLATKSPWRTTRQLFCTSLSWANAKRLSSTRVIRNVKRTTLSDRRILSCTRIAAVREATAPPKEWPVKGNSGKRSASEIKVSPSSSHNIVADELYKQPMNNKYDNSMKNLYVVINWLI